jgi:hypothetical protein
VRGEGVAELDEGVVVSIGEDGDEEELEEIRLYSGYSEGVCEGVCRAGIDGKGM